MQIADVSQASLLVELGIPALALLGAALLVWAVAHAVRSARAAVYAGLGAAAWLALTALLARAGVLARFELRPPPYLLLMLATVALAVALGLSRLGRRVADGVPLAALVLAQSFRLPLELVMHQAAATGVMPTQLSFSGYNFDIVTGASSLVLGLLLTRGRVPLWAVLVWNTFGFACLGAIAVIAVLTSPFVHAFGDGAINSWVAYFPYVWLPAGCVSFALAGHIVVLRRVRAEQRRPSLATA
jgi:hypothetical protein